jgi:hypothetical protein
MSVLTRPASRYTPEEGIIQGKHSFTGKTFIRSTGFVQANDVAGEG